MPVDFEAGEAWWERLAAAGFDASQPAVVASAGVFMYLTKAAITSMLRQIAALAPGSTLVMTFAVPVEVVEPEEIPLRQATEKGARALQRQRGRGFVFVEPKTARSRRTVCLAPLAVQALQKHRQRQLQERLQAGPLWHDQGLVFYT